MEIPYTSFIIKKTFDMEDYEHYKSFDKLTKGNICYQSCASVGIVLYDEMCTIDNHDNIFNEINFENEKNSYVTKKNRHNFEDVKKLVEKNFTHDYAIIIKKYNECREHYKVDKIYYGAKYLYYIARTIHYYYEKRHTERSYEIKKKNQHLKNL